MADKRISQLVDRGTVANNDVVPIVVSGATTTNKATISSIQTFMQGNLDLGVTSVGITLGSSGTDVSVSGSPITSSGNITINIPTASATNRGLLSSANWTTFNNKVSSVGLSMPSAFSVANSPITGSGTIAVTGAGTVAQYIRGDGSLADFPSGGGGGGSSVNYYLNGSVSQGTIGGIAYREMNKTPVLGAGTDFTIAADGYIASFITDAGDPALLEIPAGNWNFESYFSASSGGGSPSFYIELYKVNSGGTATLIASNSATPELISFGTSISPYFSPLAVPTTVLTVTDRLAVRYYVTHSGRTITLHTENSHLCQIITTFTTGLTALNGLTAQVQNFATGTSGTDFGISSASTTHTFNLPDASASARGVVTTGTQTIAGAKTTTSNIDVNGVMVGRGSSGGNAFDGIAGNTAVGTQALLSITTGYPNTALGSTALRNITTGANNIAIGSAAGNVDLSSGAANTTSSTSIYIGNNSKPNSNGGSNEIVIGNNGAGSGSNTVTIGNSSTTENYFTGNIRGGAFIKTGGTSSQFLKADGSIDSTAYTTNTGTVTSVGLSSATSGVTIGSTPITTSGTITLAIATASGSQNGLLSSTDWTTFNNKQNALTNPITGTGATGQVAYWNGTNSQTGSNNLFWDNTNVKLGIGTNTPESTGLTIAGGGIIVSLDSGAARKVLELYANSTGAKVSSTYVGASSYGSLELLTSNEARLTISAAGAATFSSSVGVGAAPTGTYGTLSVSGGISIKNDNSAKLEIGRYSAGVSNSYIKLGPSSNALIFTNNTDVADIFAILNGGNVGVGTTTPSITNYGIEFSVSGINKAAEPEGIINIQGNRTSDSNIGGINFWNSSTFIAQIVAARSGANNSGDLRFTTVNSGTSGERMRITSDGAVLVGATGTPSSSISGIALQNPRTLGPTLFSSGNVSDSRTFIQFINANGVVGSISTSGSSTSFNTSSDYRLKENVKPIENALFKLQKLKPCTFNFIADAEEEIIGFLAHEVQEVIPQAVNGEKDAVKIEQIEVSPAELDEEGNVITEAVIEEQEVPVYQGIDHSKLVPLLVAAIQELKTEIDSLKNQIK